MKYLVNKLLVICYNPKYATMQYFSMHWSQAFLFLGMCKYIYYEFCGRNIKVCVLFNNFSFLTLYWITPIITSWLEQFSFECQKVIGFTFATLHDWLKNFALIFHPIRSKTKTNRDSLARVSRTLRQLPVITLSFDWFTVLCVFFVIG